MSSTHVPAKVYDRHRQKHLMATPEEKVRQDLCHWLITQGSYPIDAIYTEVVIHRGDGTMAGRADIVVEGRMTNDAQQAQSHETNGPDDPICKHQIYRNAVEQIGSLFKKYNLPAVIDDIPLSISFNLDGKTFYGSFDGMAAMNVAITALYKLTETNPYFDGRLNVPIRYAGAHVCKLGNFDPNAFFHGLSPLSFDATVQGEWNSYLGSVFEQWNLWDFFSCDEYDIYPYADGSGAIMLMLHVELGWRIPVIIKKPLKTYIRLLKTLPKTPPRLVSEETLESDVGIAYSKNRCLDLTHAAMVIECKRPNVALGDQVMEQGQRYADIINAAWLVLDNQQETLVYRKHEGGWLRYEKGIPSYKELLQAVHPKHLVRPKNPSPCYLRPGLQDSCYHQLIADQIVLGDDSPRAILPGILEYDYALTHTELISLQGLLEDICEDVNDAGSGWRNIRFPSGGDGEYLVRSFDVTWLDGSFETLRFALFASIKVANDKRHGNRRAKTGAIIATNRDGHDACSAHLNFAKTVRKEAIGEFLDVIHTGAMTIAVGAVKKDLVLKEIRQHLPASFFREKHMVLGTVPMHRRITEGERAILFAGHIRMSRALALTKAVLRERKAAGLL